MHERQKGQADWPRGFFYCKPRTKGLCVQPMWLEVGQNQTGSKAKSETRFRVYRDASRVLERNKILQIHSLPAGKWGFLLPFFWYKAFTAGFLPRCSYPTRQNHLKPPKPEHRRTWGSCKSTLFWVIVLRQLSQKQELIWRKKSSPAPR